MAVGDYLLQVRALDPGSGVPGNPQSWSWTVAECNQQQYAAIGTAGNLTCHPCPAGGDCSSLGTTASGVIALPGYWAPSVPGPRLRFFRCLRPSSCLGGAFAKDAITNLSFVSRCAEKQGYTPNSTLCAVCLPEFVRAAETKCLKCADHFMLYISAILLALASSGFVTYKAHKARTEEVVDMLVKASKIARSAVQRIIITHVVTMSSLGNLNVRSTEILRVR